MNQQAFEHLDIMAITQIALSLTNGELLNFLFTNKHLRTDLLAIPAIQARLKNN